MNENSRKMENNPFAEVPVIFSYSRAQAIEDGVLVDLTEWARETGFKIPVACTSAVWNGYIAPPEGTRECGQSERGRAHDVLWMLYLTIRSQKPNTVSRNGNGRRPIEDRLYFEVAFLQAPRKHETVRFKSICGPGDHGEPVVTIMLPDED